MASHQRINVGISAIGLSLVTFFVVQACCGHLPLCSNFSRNSTISPPVSFVASRGTFGWNPSHPTPVFSLYNPDAFSRSQSVSLGKASSNFFNSSFFQGLSSTFCTLSSHCQCFAPSFLFALQRSNNLASSSSFLQYLHSSSPHCWLRYFVEKSGTAFWTINHLFHLSLMHLLHFSFFIFLLHVFQPFIPFVQGVLPSCVGPRFLAIFRKHLRDPSTVFGIHASF